MSQVFDAAPGYPGDRLMSFYSTAFCRLPNADFVAVSGAGAAGDTINVVYDLGLGTAFFMSFLFIDDRLYTPGGELSLFMAFLGVKWGMGAP